MVPKYTTFIIVIITPTEVDRRT